MKILYAGHTRFPTEKAHGHQIAQVCSAMTKLGHDVTLVAPTVWTPITESPFAYYGIYQSLKWVKLNNFDALNSPFIPNQLAFMVSMRSYRKKLSEFFGSNLSDLLYCRSHAVLPPMLRTGKPVILELHRLPKSGRGKFIKLANKCKKIICLTSPMRDRLLAWGVDASKLQVEGDAVSLRRFDNMPNTDEAKRRYHLPCDRPVIGYVGRLRTMGMEKGVSDLLNALSIMKNQGEKIFGLFVGGPDNDKKFYEKEAVSLGLSEEEVCFVGEVPSLVIPSYLSACDVLAMPFPDLPHYRENMSPLKMFEYMAAGKPIIASDLPTIRDVLDEETAFLCKPGDAENLAEELNSVLDTPDEAVRRASNAKDLVKEYSWEKRMERVLF